MPEKSIQEIYRAVLPVTINIAPNRLIAMHESLDEIETVTFEDITNNSDRIRTKLLELRGTFNSPVSRPFLTVEYSQKRIVEPFLTTAIRAYQNSQELVLLDSRHQGLLETFRLFFETGHGASIVNNYIVAAENDLRGTLSEELATAHNHARDEINISQEQSARNHARDLRRFMGLGQKLIEDKTGQLVIDEAVSEMEKQALLNPFVSEFVVRGARYAQRFYKEVYPLTAEL